MPRGGNNSNADNFYFGDDMVPVQVRSRIQEGANGVRSTDLYPPKDYVDPRRSDIQEGAGGVRSTDLYPPKGQEDGQGSQQKSKLLYSPRGSAIMQETRDGEMVVVDMMSGDRVMNGAYKDSEGETVRVQDGQVSYGPAPTPPTRQSNLAW